jgi:hypothetical protein
MKRIALAACFVISCREIPRLDVPPETTHVAIVSLDASGRFIAASEIALVRGGVEAELDPETMSALAGWSDEAIGPEIALAQGSIEGRIKEASGCSGRLPRPTFFATIDEDRLGANDPSLAPELAAPWLEDLCPAWSPHDVSVELSCVSDRCASGASRVRSCGFTIGLEDCELGAGIEGAFDPRGEICTSVLDPNAQCSARSGRRLHCDAPASCDLEIHVADPSSPPFEVERIAVVDPLPWIDEQRSETVQPLHRGWVRDLAILEDRVVVSTADPGHVGAFCEAKTPSAAVALIDRARAIKIADRPAPPCLYRITADRAGGFLGAYSTGRGWALGRFDREAALTRSEEIVSATVITSTGVQVAEVTVHAAIDRAAVVVTSFDELERGTSTLHLFRLSDLAPISTLPLGGLVAIGTPATGRTLVLSSAKEEAVLRIDLDTPEIVARTPARSRPLPGTQHRGIAYDPLRDEVLVTARDTITWVALDRSMTIPDFALPIDLGPIARFGDEYLVFGTAYTESPRLLYARLYDPAGRRFRAAAWPVATGSSNGAEVERDGEVWLLLPWTGEVARLSRR